jgi:hypothetical protein
MARLKKKLKLPSDDQGWPIMNSWQVRKWIDSSTALLYAHREKTFEIKNETQSVGASFFFTLKFDPAGNWKIVRTREVPASGTSGLNSDERKELNMIRKEEGEQTSTFRDKFHHQVKYYEEALKLEPNGHYAQTAKEALRKL